jgi:hypothetical protein
MIKDREKDQIFFSIWSSYKECMMDALVPIGDEGRGKLR